MTLGASTNHARRYEIHSEDAPLLEAAICLGEWLGVQPEVTEDQQRAIRQMLSFLRNLPELPARGFAGDFGFSLVLDDPVYAGAHCGSWSVSVCGECLEIFSCGHDSLENFEWELTGTQMNRNHRCSMHEWIAQVTNPRGNFAPGCSFVIHACVWRTCARSRDAMVNKSVNSSKQNLPLSELRKLARSSGTVPLTDSEIERLRRVQSEQIDYALKVFSKGKKAP